MSDASKFLTACALLAQFDREAQQHRPEEIELQLAQDGWQLYGGTLDKPVPIPVDQAYVVAEKDGGRGQVVLDETRKHCGIAEKVNVELETTTPSGRVWDEDRQLWTAPTHPAVREAA